MSFTTIIVLSVAVVFPIATMLGYRLGQRAGLRKILHYLAQPTTKLKDNPTQLFQLAAILQAFGIDESKPSAGALIMQAAHEARDSLLAQTTNAEAHNGDYVAIEPLGAPIGHLRGTEFYDMIKMPDGRRYRFIGSAAYTNDGDLDHRCLPPEPRPDCVIIEKYHIYQVVS